MSRVLIVDDAQEIRIMLSAMIGVTGHIAEEAHSGLAALQMLHKQPYDLVLLDIRMPGLDGLDVLATLRAAPPKHVPRVVIMTASPDEQVERRAMRELGAEAFYDKLNLTPDVVESLLKAPPASQRFVA
ncbi:MAG: response regulator [Tepidisphaeraceae bacterium]